MKSKNYINGELPKDYIDFIPSSNVEQETDGEYATNALIMMADDLLENPELARLQVDDAKDWVDENHL